MPTTERAVISAGVAVLVLMATAGLASSQEVVKPPEVVTLESIPRETPQIAKLKKAIEAEIDAYSGRAVEMND